MSFTKITIPDEALASLIVQAIAKLDNYKISTKDRWWLVDVANQRLVLVRGRTPEGAWPVSTATVGLDNRQDSGGTPTGAHRIARKIGADSPLGAIFVSRKATGEIWRSDRPTDADLILSRVLTLSGCEPGVNLGPGVDSEARYIYLHGTNHEDQIGQPVSHGCVRLNNHDICDVFDQVAEGDPVVIL